MLFVAATLRLAWIDVGLPEVVHVDAFKYVDAARAMAESGDWRPRHFQAPAFYTELLAAMDAALGLRSDFAAHLGARLLTALIGVALVFVVWLAARPVVSAPGALAAAAMAASSTLLVSIARWPMTDGLTICFMTLGLWSVARESPRKRGWIAAGVFLGLAVASKWTGLYLVFFYAAAAAVQIARARPVVRRMATVAMPAAAAPAIGALVFLIVNPYFPAYWAEYRDRFRLEILIQRYGHVGRVQYGWTDWLWSSTPACDMPWLSTSLPGTLGWPAAIAALAGAVAAILAIRRGRSAAAMHVLYVVLFLAMISAPGHVKAPRYLGPVLPSLFILAAIAVERLCARLPASRRRAAWLAAGALLVAGPLAASSAVALRARRPMTGQQAEAWIAANVARDAKLMIAPFFLDNLGQLDRPALFLSGVGARQARIPDDPRSNCELAPIYHAGLIDELRAEGTGYVVANSWFDDFFLPWPENERWFPRSVENYAQWRARLESEGERVWSIRAREAGCLGPDIEVFRLRAAGEGRAP